MTLHARVAAELRARIERGEFAPGSALPSEAQLGTEFGASRGTIRTALATLRHEGVIAGGQGRPPTVRDAPVSQPFESFLSFTAWAEHSGRTPGQRTVEIARRGASRAAAIALGIDPGAPVIDVLRLRLLDGEPVMVERASFVEPVGRLLFDFDPDAGSIYAQLSAHGVDLHSARRTFDAIAAETIDADLLGIETAAPLLRERRRAATPDGTPVEYGDDRYRPERVTFTIEHSRPAAPGSTIPDLRLLKEPS